MIQQFILTILAGQAGHNTSGGKVLTVKSCTLPLNVSFDGGAYTQIQAGSVIERTTAFKTLNFQNLQGANVTVVFYVGDVAAPFSPADNSASNAATYAVGNLGIANGAAAAGLNPACLGSGFLQITNGMFLRISNLDPVNGHRRQTIYFSVDPAAAFNLAILDISGNTFMILSKGQQIQLTADSVFELSGIGGTVGVAIGQIYLTNN